MRTRVAPEPAQVRSTGLGLVFGTGRIRLAVLALIPFLFGCASGLQVAYISYPPGATLG